MCRYELALSGHGPGGVAGSGPLAHQPDQPPQHEPPHTWRLASQQPHCRLPGARSRRPAHPQQALPRVSMSVEEWRFSEYVCGGMALQRVSMSVEEWRFSEYVCGRMALQRVSMSAGKALQRVSLSAGVSLQNGASESEYVCGGMAVQRVSMSVEEWRFRE